MTAESLGTLAAKPPMIGSGRVTVPPRKRTRSATVVFDGFQSWTISFTGGGGGGNSSAPAGAAPDTSNDTAATMPTINRPSLVPPILTTVRVLQKAARECAPKIAGS